jgi:L-asparaginase
MHVHVIATGGTIASTADGSTGAAPALSGSDLLETVPELDEYADLTVETVADRPGFDMSPDVAAMVARRVHRSDADAVVVTHGTDTLAETARYLDCTCEGPVVVTGAQRRPDELGSDGPTNLRTAVRATADDRLDAGVVVAFDEELHAAATARKAHTCALGAFRSPAAGPVARVTRHGVRWHRDPPDADGRLPVPDDHPTVPLVVSASGVGRAGFDAAADRGEAVVVAGTGLGNTTAALGEAVAAADCPVVVASRCHAGPTEPVYGTPGGGTTLSTAGHVRFSHATPWATRIEAILSAAADRLEARFDDPSGNV